MMVERRAIVDVWRRGEAAAMVTLVRVEGSSYRRTGARLLVARSGEYVGSISGGCLEAEVVRKALWKVAGGAMVDRYSTLFDDTAEIPYGLGCGGTVSLLLEPAGTPEFEALMQALEASLKGVGRRVTTNLPGDTRQFARSIESESGERLWASPAAGASAAADDVFQEWLGPPQRLVLFGAGDDAKPMVRLAALLGWRVIVVDSRAQWARPERFPEAERVCATDVCPRIEDSDAVVLMTHSYEQDRAWLAAALPARPRYLGLLGSRHRSALLASESAALLGWTVGEVCERLFAPVGLDLGGDGAEAIALATVAEIQACCEGKLGSSRRMTAALVAEHIAKDGASQYLQAQCSL